MALACVAKLSIKYFMDFVLDRAAPAHRRTTDQRRVLTPAMAVRRHRSMIGAALIFASMACR